MRINFTEEEIKNEANKVYIEDDDVLIEGEFIEGEGRHFVITGKAVIEGETYHDFETEFELSQEPPSILAGDILKADWEWYDYVC